MNEVLILKARHFKDTKFGSPTSCAIAKAAKEQFVAVEINASSTYMFVDYKTFYNINYDYTQFNEDKLIAESKNYSEEIIREVKLIKI